MIGPGFLATVYLETVNVATADVWIGGRGVGGAISLV